MQHSFWKNRFADKEFLFHVWLAPFCSSEASMVAGGKFATWLLGGAVLIAFALALRATGIPLAPLWTFLLFSAGNHFVFRLSECRAHVLSVGLFVAGVACLLKSRWRSVFAIGFVYSWSYAAPHLLPGVALVLALGEWTHEKRFPWRGILAAALGVLAGMLVHPYFPNNFRLWWIQNVVVLSQAWNLGGDVGLHLGEEFGSILPRSLVMSSTAVFAALVLGSLLSVAAARQQRISRRTIALLGLLWASFTMYCLSARFIEYFAPAAVWLLASATSDLVDRERLATWWREKRGRLSWAVAAAAVLLGVFHVRSMDRSLEEVRKTRGPVMAGAARWTRAHVRPGENVAHFNWGDFVQVFHFDPDHRYINGLDPSFMLVVDPSRIHYLEDVRTGREALVAHDLGDVFDADVLIVTKEVPRQVYMCENAGLEKLFEDDTSAVYRLR
jgi:hypothetical protein